MEKQFPIVPWGLLSNVVCLVICYKINCIPVSRISHILQPEITLIEEKREMYSVIESMEDQIRKHKRLKNSMNLSLDSKKPLPNQ